MNLGRLKPNAPLLENANATCYGTSRALASAPGGAVFSITSNNVAALLHSFTGAPADGSLPIAPLAEGHDGVLYGLSIDAAGTGLGLLFRMGKDGSGFHVVRSVASTVRPLAGSDGALYGSTPFGGDIDGGTIYRFGQMLRLAKTPDTGLLGLAGIPGDTYDLQRSADLRRWTTLSTFLVPPIGFLSSIDSAPPPAAAFYRLVPR